VTPAERHARRDPAILAAREQVYAAARARHPARWSRGTRNWAPIGEVWLNPLKTPTVSTAPASKAAKLDATSFLTTADM
jgi:hypothetical protein